MKTHRLILLAACILSLLGPSCTNDLKRQIASDAEKVLLAGGGALLISGGNGTAAVTAMTAQEIQNIPGLKKFLAASNSSAKAPVPLITP